MLDILILLVIIGVLSLIISLDKGKVRKPVDIEHEPLVMRRALAAIFDYGMLYIILYFYLMLFGEPIEGGYQVEGIHHSFLAFIAWLIYFPIIEGTLGYTLGKGLLDLKVLEEDGSTVSVVGSLKRHLLDVIEFSFLGLAAILMVKLSSTHQRIGDLWAHTHVIHVKKTAMKSALNHNMVENQIQPMLHPHD